MDKVVEPEPISMPQPREEKILDSGDELRILNIEDHIKILLLEGKAEVFGRELPIGVPVYYHQGERFAIYTFHGAKVQISGRHRQFLTKKTPMQLYVNIHSAFNQLRNTALQNRQIGPTILITGSNSSGKSSLCKILVNYSLRLGWRPILCDIDLSNNEITPPGCMAAASIDETLPNDDLIQSALCYFHGTTTPEKTLDFFSRQIQELSNAVRLKLENDLQLFNSEHQIENESTQDSLQQQQQQEGYQIDQRELEKYVAPAYPEMFASGVIINGFTPSSERTHQLLTDSIKMFKVDIVIVLDNEMLAQQLQLQFTGQQVQIIELPKSGGVQSSRYDETIMKERYKDDNPLAAGQIYESYALFEKYQEYFRGRHYLSFSKQDKEVNQEMIRNEYDPQDIKLPVADFKIYEIRGLELSKSALQAGAATKGWITVVEEVPVQRLQTLQHKILAVLVPTDAERMKMLRHEISLDPKNNKVKDEFDNMLMRCSTAGLMQIKDYHQEEGKLEVRTTSLEGLASNYLLVSQFKLNKII